MSNFQCPVCPVVRVSNVTPVQCAQCPVCPMSSVPPGVSVVTVSASVTPRLTSPREPPLPSLSLANLRCIADANVRITVEYWRHDEG